MSEKRFVVSGLLLCEKPMLITATKCDTVKRNTRLEVDGIERVSMRKVASVNQMEWRSATLRSLMAGPDTCRPIH